MSNGKIMCNHGVNLFKCQTCIDALVAEQIEKQEQRITKLEQQLKAANGLVSAAGYNSVDDLVNSIVVTDEDKKLAEEYRKQIREYFANNLEGK